ncbi:hypothetical protein I302_100312 [Kwoniella bestiolae CBS 10118]|uniref:HECT-type E3 ubiquitin transferase n=1 Tax=Kwoniella bestiolae CBS 10118 TaxID=1296100 RepID=A0A1B9G4N6_9TREE|nr:ubiquitin-protein ligase E3 C [Kwoniella bestiolae CBS 10118]OCF26007.1 ubiquitin-protein ligase E3 C [Kwoniella bestiolae CBS 10118]
MFDPDFTSSNTRYNDINLSTSQSTSSTALLSNIRLEREQRERKRREEICAIRIQKVWRGRKVARRFRDDLYDTLDTRCEGGDVEGVGRGLVVLLRDGWGRDRGRIGGLVGRWCEIGSGRDEDGIYRFIQPLHRDQGQDWSIVLGLLSVRILQLVNLDPTSNITPTLLSSLEIIFDPRSYSSLPQATQQYAKETIVNIISSKSWVETIVQIMEQLMPLNLPKKKNPSLLPLTRLLTAPFSLMPPFSDSPLIPPLINHLLAIPSLPSSLPIPALTHLSTHLNLFTLLLPYASQNTQVLNQGRLESENDKTYFLANLTTFGITGGMLARFGVDGISTWMSVIGNVLKDVNEGWGKWVDGMVDDDEDEPIFPIMVDSDDEDNEEEGQPSNTLIPATRPRRIPLPKAISNRVTILATAQHLSTLMTHIIQPSSSSRAPVSLLNDFSMFCTGLLSAFRGSPKWENVLDSLMNKGLVRRVWREGVRGKWTESDQREVWDGFTDNPNTPPLILLTYIYNHYLLLTPDDEFFSTSSNALSTDEILELAGVWRNLAFWGYMIGVSGGPSGNEKMGNEEIRGLFTRGVTRVVERNARRHFADPNIWVMRSQLDLKGFVEAAVYEDAELTAPNDADIEMNDPSSLPRWARARQRFTKRQMAYISPRLGLLNNLPMSVPFQTRLEVFRKFIESDQDRLGLDYHSRRQRNYAKIRRDRISQDGFDELGNLGPALKSRIEITFVDQHGMTEAGIDGGGLFKEFLTNLSKEVFDTNRGLWLATDQNELYPNPHSYATEPHQLEWYRFIGQVLGKAMYEGMLVDVSFADFFLAKWLGRQSYLDDLNSLDKELYKGLIILKNYPKPEELALNFAITEDEFGVKRTIDLVPNGSEIAVNAENRHEYIQLVCKYKLDRQISAQSRAFFNGLSDLIDAKWLRMFDQQELQQLIGGEETLIDIDDLRAHCSVDGFPNDITPRLFWKVVKGFSHEQRRALLRFVTSCSRPPLLGFGYLYPKFGVKFNGNDTSRLPSASACFNLLKLPGYTTEQSLRAKLLQAITSGAGFDMS